MSTQEKISRNRKPRVHITMNVETNGAQQQVELPFMVGVMGDYSGNNPQGDLKPFKDRTFTSINKENFNEVLEGMKPGLRFRVEDVLSEEGGEMGVELAFRSMADFEPGNVAKQIPQLKALLDKRQQLKDIAAAAERSEDFDQVLEELLSNEKKIAEAAGQAGDGEAGDEEKPSEDA